MTDSKNNMHSSDMQFSMSSFDDFTHLSADKAMTSSFTKSQYSQVIFHDLSDVYPTDSDIKCTYSLTDNVKPQAGDKIAIFKVGWVSVSDYITFERAKVSDDPKSVLVVTFRADTFPKKDNELYQLCYVTSGNVIAGASTPFSFFTPNECEFVSIDDPSDPSLVIFRSKVAQLQSDLDRKNEERESITSKYQLLEERYNIIRREFEKCENELVNSNEKISHLLKKEEEIKNEKQELENCLSKCNEEICNLKEENNDCCLKIEKAKNLYEEFFTKLESMGFEKDAIEKRCSELKKSLQKMEEDCIEYKKEITNLNAQYKTVLVENKVLINKLEELERKSLQNLHNSENNISLEAYEGIKNELEKEKIKMSSAMNEQQCLQDTVNQLNRSNDNLTLEVRNLSLKLTELAEKHNQTTADKVSMGKKLKEADGQIDYLNKELNGLRAALNEKGDGPRYLQCMYDRDLYKVQFETLQTHQAKFDEKMKKKIEEMKNDFVAEKKKLFNEKLSLEAKIIQLKKELQQLSSSSQGQQKEKESKGFKDPASQLYEVFSDACSHVQTVFEGKSSKSGKHESEKNTIDLENHQLKEKLKILHTQKAEISENLVQQRHRCEESERSFRIIKEENAALKSRISVLEYELATLKSANNNGTIYAPVISSSSSEVIPQPYSTYVAEQLDSLNKSLPAITEFNKLVSEQNVLSQKIQEERNEKIVLQSKVEFLLQEDAQMSVKLDSMTKKYEALLKEKEELSKNINVENIVVLQNALDENDQVIKSLKLQLETAEKEKNKLNTTVNEMRTELVGKISVDNLSDYKQKIDSLKKQLQKKEQDCRTITSFIQEGFFQGDNQSTVCPFCFNTFPPSARDTFVQHFESHMF